ncbi:olfactory receptor 11H6-like [Rhinatrema bivittatum]|uniref:olfactory receptor 11H6-like n=1 Tax=Rhinatrema bivittatum TaxID=194408 RepID=UPI00112C9910|nr:olfactory receptor 11H6-like [Rhinatrema bivittatum]
MEKNFTLVTEFVLLGFPTQPEMQVALFLLFFIIYAVTLLENLAIITLVISDRHLHKPMYFFISNLSFVEMIFTTTIIPKLLTGFLTERKTISLAGCFTQLYFFLSLGTVECCLLTVMSYDRYIAICKPLHYATIMTNKMCRILAIICWVIGFLWIAVPIYLISQLLFCGPNVMNHFICDMSPLFALTCTRSYLTERTCYTFSTTMILAVFLLTIVSYTFIISTIMMIPSTSGRKKAFSTCTSHLTVISIFYGSLIFMYVRPAKAEALLDMDKVIAVFYTAVTPLINPLIYTLRNKDVTMALYKAMGGKQVW